MNSSLDAIVIGAGAAGLACAHELLRQGKKIQLLEARDRVGGRVWTSPVDPSGLHVEFGAEFIHGHPREVMERAQCRGHLFYDVTDTHFFFPAERRGGSRLGKRPHFWEELEGITSRLSDKRQRDRRVSDFLRSLKSVRSDQRRIFQSFVEGFHSADLDQMGEKGLFDSEEATQDESLNGTDQFRWVRGYGPFLEDFARDLLSRSDVLRLQTRLRGIDLKQSHIEIHVSSHREETLRCRNLVLALPLGVLKASLDEGGFFWNPGCPPALQKALSGVHMGHIQKLIFHFRERFWESLSKEKTSFFHAGPEHDFPTWWSMMPLRTAQLVAWQGGPRARIMRSWTFEQKMASALQTLSLWSGKTNSFLSDQLIRCQHHDWSSDPFTQGAYSYIGVDGMSAARRLAKKFDRIILAGEHTVMGPDRGTVHGALSSGLRAAKICL